MSSNVLLIRSNNACEGHRCAAERAAAPVCRFNVCLDAANGASSNDLDARLVCNQATKANVDVRCASVMKAAAQRAQQSRERGQTILDYLSDCDGRHGMREAIIKEFGR